MGEHGDRVLDCSMGFDTCGRDSTSTVPTLCTVGTQTPRPPRRTTQIKWFKGFLEFGTEILGGRNSFLCVFCLSRSPVQDRTGEIEEQNTLTLLSTRFGGGKAMGMAMQREV